MSKQLDIRITAQDPDQFMRRLQAKSGTHMTRRNLKILFVIAYTCIAINIALIAINAWSLT